MWHYLLSDAVVLRLLLRILLPSVRNCNLEQLSGTCIHLHLVNLESTENSSSDIQGWCFVLTASLCWLRHLLILTTAMCKVKGVGNRFTFISPGNSDRPPTPDSGGCCCQQLHLCRERGSSTALSQQPRWSTVTVSRAKTMPANVSMRSTGDLSPYLFT